MMDGEADECGARLRALLEAVGAAIWEARIEGEGVQFVSVHPNVEALLGYPVERWLSDPRFWLERVHSEDRTAVSAFYRRVLAADGPAHPPETGGLTRASGSPPTTGSRRAGAGPQPAEIEYRMRTACGRAIWFLEVVHRLGGWIRGIMLDISERKAVEHRLEHLVHHDALTGLPNRQWLIERLYQLLHDPLAGSDPLAGRNSLAWEDTGGQGLSAAEGGCGLRALLVVDLDRFNLVNDSLGHGVGDRLLRAVALRLRRCVPDAGLLARLGGDEFALILADLSGPRAAAAVAERILSAFARPFLLDTSDPVGLTGPCAPPGAGDPVAEEPACARPPSLAEAPLQEEVFFSLSIGISVYPADGRDPHTLLRNADAALHRAKEQGGNGFHFFTADMDEGARRRVGLETALRNALERGEFVLHYQPQVHAPTGAVVGMEALLRWNHPQRGMVGPDEFVPVLEETGLILPVGEWVLRAACRQHRAWREAGVVGLRMAVNLSARQLRHAGLVERVGQIVREAGIPAQELELEITETAVMAQFARGLQTLQALRALGVRLSLDDFGTGYSSLGQLKRLPVNAVKIAQAFVRDLPADTRDAAIARAVIALARDLGLQVIAEGVESAEQLAFLRAQGCELIQGYHFSRPLPAERLPAQRIVGGFAGG